MTEELLNRYVDLCYLKAEEEFRFGDAEKKNENNSNNKS